MSIIGKKNFEIVVRSGELGPALKGIPYPAVTLGSKDGHMECHTPTPEGKKPFHTGIQPFTLSSSHCSTYNALQFSAGHDI